ncbi:MAG TPA: hypothetical protein DIC19_05860 [Erysipelotrichaceae bacterium]|nr:hypothetical protein [Erysipelotrichaceae bacterium]
MQEYEEISLRDLILILLKGWKLIVATTIVVLTIAFGVFLTLNTTTYTASTQAKLMFRPDYPSKFGTYALPQSKAEDFLILLKDETFLESLSTTLKIDSNQLETVLAFTPINTTDFTIKAIGATSEDTSELINTVVDSAEDYINYVVSKKMFTSFDTSYNTKLIEMEKSKTDKQRMFTYFETELKSITPLLNNNVINPVFSSLSANLVQVKANLAEIDFSILESKDYLNEIQTTLDNLKSFDSFKLANHNLETPKIELTFNNINKNETKRFNAMTLFPVSLVLGVMLGAFIVFFKNYWSSSTNR